MPGPPRNYQTRQPLGLPSAYPQSRKSKTSTSTSRKTPSSALNLPPSPTTTTTATALPDPDRVDDPPSDMEDPRYWFPSSYDPHVPCPEPLDAVETRQLECWMGFRREVHASPIYMTVGEMKEGKGKGRGGESRGKKKEIVTDPFRGGVGKYSQRYTSQSRKDHGGQGKGRAGLRLGYRTYALEFFPRSLWSVLDPRYDKKAKPSPFPTSSSAAPAASHNPNTTATNNPPKRNPGWEQIELDPTEAEIMEGVAAEREKGKEGERGGGDGGDGEEEDDDEVVDDEFDDEEGDDYDAEQYFDNGEDDVADGFDGGGRGVGILSDYGRGWITGERRDGGFCCGLSL